VRKKVLEVGHEVLCFREVKFLLKCSIYNEFIKMHIRIIAPGKMDKEFKVIFDEYLKRCKNNIEIKEFVVKENDKNSRIKIESEIILNYIKNFNNVFVVLMDIGGSLVSSEDLVNIIENQKNNSTKNLIFVIGGSYGVGENVKNVANLKISFGRNTWPHNLMKVMLMEQIFRFETIIDGRDYHH
jgi:23S rRNA (pseudouridine1915-N3)-methyltransferase